MFKFLFLVGLFIYLLGIVAGLIIGLSRYTFGDYKPTRKSLKTLALWPLALINTICEDFR